MQTPDKKYKKLKKSRLWPSIVLFIAALVVGGVLLSAELCLYMSYAIESKYMQSLSKMELLVQRVESGILAGEDETAALEGAAAILGGGCRMALIDETDHVVAAKGAVTVDLTQKAVLDIGEEIEIYWDKSTRKQAEALLFAMKQADDGIRQMDETDVMVIMFLSQTTPKENLFEMEDDASVTDALFAYSYWQAFPLSDNNRRLLIKDDLIIQRDDLMFGIAITLVSGLMFLLILSIQFASIISKALAHRRMEKLLLMDMVTGGSNRLAFTQAASKILAKRKNAQKTYVIADVSIRKYQNYCSMYGTQAGEALLVQLDRCFAQALSKDETFGHINGADFALLFAAEPGDAGKQRVLERLEGFFAAQSQLVPSGFLAGICWVEPQNGEAASRKNINIDALYMNAGIAKDSVSTEDGSSVACFGREMWEEQLWQHKVENTMQAAIDNEEFLVYIQPKYNPNTETLLGAEALVRWMSPTEGMISPGRFIPIFEKTGFVTKLDDYMISHVAKLQSQWMAEGKKLVPVSVNVSRAHFAQPDLAEHIRDLVDAYRLPHEYIEIELTESAFFDDKKALLTTVHKLQEYGFDVSMDDFGSGYSSLNSLKDLPLDVLKLDAEFFRGDDFDTRGEIVVEQAIALAKQLHMRIVAEGVEKKEQVEFLARNNCDMIQSYYYAKPMPAEEYKARLSQV